MSLTVTKMFFCEEKEYEGDIFSVFRINLSIPHEKTLRRIV
jgi:hypothetical protein